MSDALERRRLTAEQAREREAEARRRIAEWTRERRAAERRARQAGRQRHAALQALYRRGTTRQGENVLDALIEAGCLVRRTETYESETLGSRIMHSAPGRTLRSLRDAMSRPSVVPPDPRGAWLPALLQPSMAAEPARHYETRVRVWYEDRAGRLHWPDEPFVWGTERVRAIIAAAAEAEGLPGLTLPRRAATGSRRASPHSRS